MKEKRVAFVEPEPINVCDDTGKQIRCPSCDTIPHFIEDDESYFVSCGCEAAFLKKKDNPELSRQEIKDFLFEKWLVQLYGLCTPWRRIDEPKGLN